MKRLSIPVLFLAAALLAPRAQAQCPFTAQFTTYGAACSPSGALDSTLTGLFTNGAGGCSVSLTIYPSADVGNLLLYGKFLVVGFQSVSIPLPTGCNLLAFPTVILTYPPLLPTNTLVLLVPNDPAFVGANAYAQGVVWRQDYFTYADFFDMTAGTQISLL